MGKVLHVSDAAHQKAVQIAGWWGVSLRECADRLILEGFERHFTPKTAVVPKRVPTRPAKPKDIEGIISGPPFWERRGQ